MDFVFLLFFRDRVPLFPSQSWAGRLFFQLVLQVRRLLSPRPCVELPGACFCEKWLIWRQDAGRVLHGQPHDLLTVIDLQR